MWGRMGILPHKSWRWNFDVPADLGGHRLARSIAILDISWMASRMFFMTCSRVSPYDTQPGRAGKSGTNPLPGSCSRMTV